MIKNILLILIILLFSNKFVFSNEVFIATMVNNQIITNYDVEKESKYLKVLNPQLSDLSKSEIYKISKNSLINEMIKENEIKKFININEDNTFVENYLKDLYTKLNFKNENEFKYYLENNNVYSLAEIRKKIQIEVLWNELIFSKYNYQVNINKEALVKKINRLDNKKRKEYLLSEIVFELKKTENLDSLSNKIRVSINEIGFGNTANLYSISESSKFGGNIGWVDENNLSETISGKLRMINKDQTTDFIQIGNNFLILKIEDIREKNISIDKKKELERMIKFETNKQLNQFARIYFNKARLNYTINEK
tara:strand:+ start:324 stop:1250 length:927 start_codon:yes stop_codon:yes gene_type:complete